MFWSIIPCSRPKLSNLYPHPRQKCMKSIPLTAAHMGYEWLINGSTLFGKTSSNSQVSLHVLKTSHLYNDMPMHNKEWIKMTTYWLRVRSIRENLKSRPCYIDRAIARSMWEGGGLRFSSKENTFAVKKLFALLLQASISARNKSHIVKKNNP